MIRCPRCGRRLRDAAVPCATHGAPPPAPVAAQPDDTTPFVVPTPDLPMFRVRRTLGQGGFGAVFLAERISDGQAVAIKVARADNIAAGESLLREAYALSAVGVPHVPAVYERGVLDDGAVYVVMEFVQAPLLAERMNGLQAPMPLDDFARDALAILAAVETAHGRGFVHCDLKPENMFVDELRAPSCSTSAWCAASGGGRRVESTKEEAPAGTPEYMSPEQCEGRTDIDARSDIYALGAIFYEMLAGAPPFWGNSAEVQQSHRSRRPPALARRVEMAVALEDAIMRCLAKDPERRPASVAELRRALQAGIAAERARRDAAQPAASREVTGQADAKTAAKAAAPARERRAVALLFFECKSDVAAVREAMTSVGAQLAHTAGAQYVLAFGHEVGDNPTRAAANAGEMLVARGLAKRALVDLASVSIQARPDGTRRYQSPLFSKKEQYPGEPDPEGVLLSAAAVEVLPDLPVEPVPGRGGVALLQKATQVAEQTTTRMGVAPLVGRDDLLRTLLDSARAAAAGSSPTIVTLLGRGGLRQDPPRADAGAAPRGGPELRDAVHPRQGGAGRRRGTDHARDPHARRCRCPTRRRPTSAARCSPSGSAPRSRGRSGPAWRSPWGGRRRSIPSSARWRRRRAPCVRPRRAPPARRCAARRASGRWRWWSRTRSSSTRPRSTRSSTRR